MKKFHHSVEKLWTSYLNKNPKVNLNTPYQSWHFCNDKESANKLVNLVLRGVKTGTSSLYSAWEPSEEKPKVGDYSIITDFSGEAKCIIRTVEVTQLPFCDVTNEMAYLEGEGDRTLNYWKKTHKIFFETYCKGTGKKFTSKDFIIYERFEVVAKYHL